MRTRMQARGAGLRSGQGGIALAITLILLAVIATASAITMQSGMAGSQVTENLRANRVAMAAAESALRYCEQQVIAGGAAVTVLPLPAVDLDRPSLWSAGVTWTDGVSPTVVPAAVVNSGTSNETWATMPMCVIESMELPRPDPSAFDEVAFLITARGFSADARLAADGSLETGGEAWIQSTLRFTP